MVNNPILQDLKSRLIACFRDRLSRVIVFGSVARGESTGDSDIDILVVLKSTENHSLDWDKSLEIAAEVSYQYDTLIALLVTTEEEYTSRQTPLFVNIRKEGVTD